MDIFGEARALLQKRQVRCCVGPFGDPETTRLDVDTSLLKSALCEATGDVSSARRSSINRFAPG